ncbi:MAG: hypothetical protein JEY91_05950 [Spirochaetaceae bacterium]|nr:hypothetical protein [Spirochaetaceae bacterium]
MSRMKGYIKMRILFLTIVLLILPLFFLTAGDRSEVWKRMYNRAQTIDQQYAIMQNIVAMDDPSLIEILDSALAEQISSLENKLNRTERDKKEQLMRMIVNELSSLRAEESAGTIFTLFTLAESHILKADCLVALGQIRAVDLVPQVSNVLRKLNFNTSDDQQVAEILAYAAITSLERMRDIRGFEQVFYASQGWYSRRIKDKASAVLQIISEDPTEPIMDIISGDSNYGTKLKALDIESNSNALKENKNRVALLSLQEGLRYSPNDKMEADDLNKLREAAIFALIENEYKNSDVVPDLKQHYERSEDINDKLMTIQAFGLNGTDAAVAWLSEALSTYNSRQLSGLSANQTELIYIKQMISSLALSGNLNAKPVLLEVQFSDYTPAIVRLSKEALKNFD